MPTDHLILPATLVAVAGLLAGWDLLRGGER